MIVPSPTDPYQASATGERAKPMQAILFVLATGILAFPVVELFEHWRRYQMRSRRKANR